MADGRPGEADVLRLLKALARARVNHVVIGGVAATLLGSPYATYDLDVVPAVDSENLERLAQALRDLEAREWDPRKEDVARDWSSVLLKSDKAWLLTTKHGPLDIMFEPAGAHGHADLIKRAETFDLDNILVAVASIEDLISMKEASGREKDRLHLPTLRKIAEQTGHA